MVTIERGDMVGECPNCGLVAKDAVDVQFPIKNSCEVCGAELDRVRAAPEAKEIEDSKITTEA